MNRGTTNFSKSIDESYLTYGLLLLLLALIAATILLGSVPPVDRDALTHHLFVPKLWLQHGGIYEIPEIPFSYYPMNLDLLYMIPLFFSNDIVPKYIHYLFALLTAWLIFRYLKKSLGIRYGLFGALFFLSVPINVKLSITVYVDLGLVFFTTASLLLLLEWAEKDFQAKYLLLAGLCCGLAAGTKYNGLLTIFILTLFVPLIYQQSAGIKRQSNSKALLYGVLFAAATLVSFSPWLVRNYVWTGNPVYPLYTSFFHHTKAVENPQRGKESEDMVESLKELSISGSNVFADRKILYHETLGQALLLPIRFFFEGKDDNPQFFDGKLNPFLLLLPLFAFFFKPSHAQERREKKFLLLFSLLYFFLTFFQTVLRIRYIVPIVPPLVILSIYGLRNIFNFLFSLAESVRLMKKPIGLLAAGIPCALLWYNADYTIGQFSLIQPLAYLGGKINREQYITDFRPEYPTILYANTHLPPDTKVLCVFLGNRGYYMDFQPVFEAPFGNGLFSTFLKNKSCGNALNAELQKRDITHVLMRDDLTASWFQQLNNQDKACIAPLFNDATKPLFNKNGYTFFKIGK
jgi:hypothetical protein